MRELILRDAAGEEHARATNLKEARCKQAMLRPILHVSIVCTQCLADNKGYLDPHHKCFFCHVEQVLYD